MLPDAVAIVRDYLFQHDDVREFVGSRTYANRNPASVQYPYVRVTAVVENEISERVLGATRVQVECYGATATDDAGARDLAATCRDVLHDLEGWDHPQGWVTEVEEASGVSPVPDLTAGKPRFLFDVRVYAINRTSVSP